MSVAEIKNHLHKLVVETENQEMLMLVSNYFDSLLSKSDWWEEISEQERKLIETGKAQIEAEKGIPHADVYSEIHSLLQRTS